MDNWENALKKRGKILFAKPPENSKVRERIEELRQDGLIEIRQHDNADVNSVAAILIWKGGNNG
jgi:hypothetical protein